HHAHTDYADYSTATRLPTKHRFHRGGWLGLASTCSPTWQILDLTKNVTFCRFKLIPIWANIDLSRASSVRLSRPPSVKPEVLECPQSGRGLLAHFLLGCS